MHLKIIDKLERWPLAMGGLEHTTDFGDRRVKGVDALRSTRVVKIKPGKRSDIESLLYVVDCVDIDDDPVQRRIKGVRNLLFERFATPAPGRSELNQEWRACVVGSFYRIVDFEGGLNHDGSSWQAFIFYEIHV